MGGPFEKFEPLDLPGLDDALVCVDGVCTVPAVGGLTGIDGIAGAAVPTSIGERVGEELPLGGAEGDLPHFGQR